MERLSHVIQTSFFFSNVCCCLLFFFLVNRLQVFIPLLQSCKTNARCSKRKKRPQKCESRNTKSTMTRQCRCQWLIISFFYCSSLFVWTNSCADSLCNEINYWSRSSYVYDKLYANCVNCELLKIVQWIYSDFNDFSFLWCDFFVSLVFFSHFFFVDSFSFTSSRTIFFYYLLVCTGKYMYNKCLSDK